VIQAEQPTALDQLFQSFRAAFDPSPLRIAITIAIGCLIFAAIVAFCVIEAGPQRKKRKLRSEALYAELKDRHQLQPSEEEIIERMVKTLASMNKRHLLLTNQGLFNTCARRLLKQGEIQEAAISELRAKLGFMEETRGRAPLPTVPFPVGYPVAVRDQRGMFPARVLDSQASALKLKVDLGGRNLIFPQGSKADIVYRNRRGAFSLRSTIVSQDGELLNLTHDDGVDQKQHREYFQRKVGIPQ
jgi:hypothetical protein